MRIMPEHRKSSIDEKSYGNIFVHITDLIDFCWHER